MILSKQLSLPENNNTNIDNVRWENHRALCTQTETKCIFLIWIKPTDFTAMVATLMVGATSEAGYAHLSRTLDISLLQIQECMQSESYMHACTHTHIVMYIYIYCIDLCNEPVQVY